MIASKYESMTAIERVTPNWKKNLPMTPFMKMTFKNKSFNFASALLHLT